MDGRGIYSRWKRRKTADHRAGYADHVKKPEDDKKKEEAQEEKGEKKKALSTETVEKEQQFANNFDHCTYNHLKMQDGVHISASRVDVSKYVQSYSAYLQDVSDHVPIIIELALLIKGRE